MRRWIFSHCPADQNDGCVGCPALPTADGKPRADNCEAVFVPVGGADMRKLEYACRFVLREFPYLPGERQAFADFLALVLKRRKRASHRHAMHWVAVHRIRDVYRRLCEGVEISPGRFLIDDPAPPHHRVVRFWDRPSPDAGRLPGLHQ